MPKTSIDYSRTIIYKIFCKDPLIEDVYIGHTTNFIKRKNEHKRCCKNGTKLKIYSVMRDYGGWENWDMVEIAQYNCKNATEARIKEQQHYELCKKTLNSIPPYTKLHKYYCFMCCKQFLNSVNYEMHLSNDMCENDFIKQSPDADTPLDLAENENVIDKKKYICECCNYSTSKMSDYKKHLITDKHQNKFNKIETSTFECVCGKICNNRTTLWRHKKTCDVENKDDIIMMLIKQNSQLIKQNNEIIEILKNNSPIMNKN